MGLIAKNNGGDFKSVEPGTYLAICYGVIDIGTHHSEWQGKPVVRRQCILQWELPTETFEVDGQQKPMIISRFYTLSLSEKSNLRPDLEAWRGRPFTQEELDGFDLKNVLGRPCMVSVVKNDKGKTVVQSVSKVMKGLNVPPQFNKPVLFSLDDYDDNVFTGLPEGFKKLIQESDEFKALFNTGRERPTPEESLAGADDIPF
jgi:hypothetical protein